MKERSPRQQFADVSQARRQAMLAALRIPQLQELINTLPAPETDEQASWHWFKRTELRREREKLYLAQVMIHEADGTPITAASIDELDAEYALNGDAARRLDALPERTRWLFAGRTFAAIRRDPVYRSVCATTRAPRRTMTSSGRPAAPRRRTGSSSTTSSTDPGSDSDSDPEPPAGRWRWAQPDSWLRLARSVRWLGADCAVGGWSR